MYQPVTAVRRGIPISLITIVTFSTACREVRGGFFQIHLGGFRYFMEKS